LSMSPASTNRRPISIGKLRGLQQCSSQNATFICLALDHRQNLRRALNPAEPVSVSDLELTRFKLEVTSELAGQATAVLLDPEFSAAQAIAAGVLPGQVALVVAVESTGYGGEPTARQSQILPSWNVEKARRMGASMIKLLVYYHPDSPTATEIDSFVRQVADECIRLDLALMLEPLSYSLAGGERLSSLEKQHVVTETARRLTIPGVDVLKAEFPLDITASQLESDWARACGDLSSASQAPWILLSAAVDFETYLRQVRVACQAGASGCAVGRAVWQESVGLASQKRAAFLKEVAPPRMEKLAKVCNDFGRPWTDFYTPPAITPDWYKAY
jgi:tagatose 1,6-diphosphate aldolase